MTNSRFRNNGQPINIAVAIRRAGKHENDVDAVVAEVPPFPPYIHWRARDNRSKWETEGKGVTKTSTVFPSWLISTRFRIRTRRLDAGSCHLNSRLDGKRGCYLNFPFRSCNSSRSPIPIPTINRNDEATNFLLPPEFSFLPSSSPCLNPPHFSIRSVD